VLSERILSESKILIVDDAPANVLLVERLLEWAGYVDVRSTEDPRQVLPMFDEYQPDLVMVDLHMPHIDGYEVIAQLREKITSYLPILVFTADTTPEARQRALEAGASDFLTKPGESAEIILRVRNFLQTKHLYAQMEDANRSLEEKVAERTKELEAAQVEILGRLALAAEYRDDDTGMHTKRVANLSAMVAKKLGVGEAEVKLIRFASLLHDLGKIGIPDEILLKKGRLTPEEMTVMQTHANIGAKILSGSKSPLLQMAETIAMSHHERWDGQGYPSGLHGEAIPLPGRIVAAADVFDALTSDRPYRNAISPNEAMKYIVDKSGSQFDPNVVHALQQVIMELHGVKICRLSAA
jgi:putative two-component system response regulator